MLEPPSGTPTRWLCMPIDHFRTFRSSIIYDPCCKDRPALEAIAGLTLTAANYTEAVEVLQKHFGNKQQIIDKHMEILLNIEGVTSGRNLKALRHLYDTIEAQIRGLNSMGVTADTYGGLLSSVVLSKIPHDICLIVSRMIRDGDRKLDDLMKMLLDELQARERSAASVGKGRENLPSTASALLAGGSGVTHTCYYCQQAHVSHACKNVTSVEEKKRYSEKQEDASCA